MIRLTVPSQFYAALRTEWLRSGASLRTVADRMGWRAAQPVSLALQGVKDLHLSTAIRLADSLGYDLVMIRREDT